MVLLRFEIGKSPEKSSRQGPPLIRLPSLSKGGTFSPSTGRRKDHSFSALSLSALAITDTDDRLIAAAASIGDSKAPVSG